MASLRPQFGASTNITITLASLTSGGTRESTAVDNTSNLFVDVLIQLSVKLGAGTPGGEKIIYIFAYGSEDGTRLTDNATGTDATIGLRDPTNLRLIGSIYTPDAGGLTYVSQPISLLAAFGGLSIPRKWGIVVQNNTGVTFSATEGDHVKKYTGINLQTV